MRAFGVVRDFLQALGSGSEVQLGVNSLGLSGVAQGLAPYAELVRSGRVFMGMTAVTGVAPGTAIGTTAAFSLFNRKGSKRDLHLLAVSMGYVSGTLGAGHVALVANTNPDAAVTSGTAITPVNCLVGSSLQSVAQPFTTATLPAAPTVCFPLWSLVAMTAATTYSPWQNVLRLDGGVVVSPGCTISFEATAGAGTSPLVVYGAIWHEVAES